jgi:iron(III) transport system ATP-binding protein
MTALLELEDVTAMRDGKVVLADVRLAIDKGEIVVLAGPSGSGKSTLLRVVLGLLAPVRGVVRLRGEVVTRDGRIVVPPERRALSMVFQDLALWPHLSVADNLAFALEGRAGSKADRALRIRGMLARVGLGGAEKRAPDALSGGERQRVALARALVTEPDLVLFDEALAGLDVTLRQEILDLVASMLRAHAAAALYVSHDPREARRLADRVAIMESGRIVQVDTMAALSEHPQSAFVRAFVAASGVA